MYTVAQIIEAIPELADFKPDGKTDFDIVESIIGTRNPKDIWPIIDAFKKAKPTHAGLAKLKALSQG